MPTKTKGDNDTRKPLLIRLSRDIHRGLKMRAAKEETSIQGLVEGLIVDYLVGRIKVRESV